MHRASRIARSHRDVWLSTLAELKKEKKKGKWVVSNAWESFWKPQVRGLAAIWRLEWTGKNGRIRGKAGTCEKTLFQQFSVKSDILSERFNATIYAREAARVSCLCMRVCASAATDVAGPLRLERSRHVQKSVPGPVRGRCVWCLVKTDLRFREPAFCHVHFVRQPIQAACFCAFLSRCPV